MSLDSKSPTRPHELRLAVLDMSGTTVSDDGLVEQAFGRAVEDVGIGRDDARYASMLGYVRDTMGMPRITVFTHLFDGNVAAAEQANKAFELVYDAQVAQGGITPIPGAEDAINELRESGLKICFATGFARHNQNMILESLGWMGLADLSLCPSDAGRGRPYPDMILTAVLALDLEDVRQVLVAGDSSSDMVAGVRSGASRVVGVLTGAHKETALRAAGATDVVPSVRDLPGLIAPRAARHLPSL